MLRPEPLSGRPLPRALLLLLATLSACGDVADSGSGVQALSTSNPLVRDSSGVRILDYGPQGMVAEPWFLTEEPRLRLGMIEEPHPYDFGTIRGAARLSDGRMAAVDVQTRELRVYAPGGAFLGLTTSGSPGDPSFDSPRLLAVLPGDSVLLLDEGTGFLTLLDSRGETARSSGASAQLLRESRVLGSFSDGTLLLERRDRSGSNSVPLGEVVRDPSVYLLLDPSSSEPREVLSILGPEELRTEVGGSQYLPRPFGVAPAVVPGPDGFVLGSSERYELRLHRGDGSLHTIIRRDLPGARVTTPHVEAARLERREALPGSAFGPVIDALLASPPERMPSHGEILVDDLGYIWVADFIPPGTARPRRAAVFAPDGLLAAMVDLPDGVRIEQIGADFLLAIGSDGEEDQWIELFHLDRGP